VKFINHIGETMMPWRSVGRAVASALLWLGLAGLLFPSHGDAKRRAQDIRPPALSIQSVSLSSDPFTLGATPLDIAIDIELPKDVDLTMLLEVSSLITSPSKRSLRFLTSRQEVRQMLQPSLTPSAASADEKLRTTVRLSWDGTDQTHKPVSQGRYDYEVRAKLLEVNEKGPRTFMVSWPKRGHLEVK
jgi:hypothetical protein